MARLAPQTTAHEAVRDRTPKKEFSHLEVTPGKNGGVTVMHHFTSYEHKPEPHIFGESEGKEALAHIAKHAGIKAETPEDDDDYEEEEYENT